MKPHISKIRRILPYSLPLSIALLALVWMVAPGTDGEAILQPASQAMTKAEATHKSTTLASERARILERVNAQEKQDEAPRNPQVAEILNQFRKGNRQLSQEAAKNLVKFQKGKSASFKFAGMEFSGLVDSKVESSSGILMGVKLDDNLGRFQMSLRPDNRILAHVLFTGESHALAIKGFPEGGAWKVEKSSVSELMCAPAGSTYPLTREATTLRRTNPATNKPSGNRPARALPLLSSNPESTYVLYIDLDGETVTNPFWNDGETIVAAPSEYVDDEVFVTNVWRRVSEDYMGFDINVTTNRAIYDATPTERRVQCIVTDTNDAAPGAGGVAILESFGQDIPCWSFNPTEYSMADTISHEVGHTVGLLHDGLDGVAEYYGGHGSGETSWSPIMGAAWADFEPPFLEEEVTQWSKGEYPNASNQEDDLQIITTQNGFGYRADDKGNTQATATALVANKGVIDDSGIIGQSTDVDWFAFTTSGGQTDISVKVLDVESDNDPQRGANLAVDLELYDASGKVVTSASPDTTLDAAITLNLPEGNYFLKVAGGARGTLATGFPAYGSIGQYSITGTIPQVNLLTVAPDSTTVTDGGGTGKFTVTTKSAWSWSASEPWITSKEPTKQSGDQEFDFTVAPNPIRTTRTAKITVVSNGVSAVHTVTQEPGDDHGDTIATATLVDQVSTTAGELETAGDLDVFRIDVKGFGTLTVNSTGPTNTYGELLDYFGTPLAANDNALEPNFRISRSVGTGTYFVRIRHTRTTGLGQYKLVSNFKSGPTIFISPESKVMAAPGGRSNFKVTCNTAWSWSTTASWIRSAEPAKQQDGQIFDYVARPNETKKVRTARIVIKSVAGTVVHTVTQNPRDADDHGNTMARATVFPTNSMMNGRLEADDDVDMFLMRFATSGQLELRSSGSTDTVCDLLDADGNVVASNDDADGVNFAIVANVPAGVYYAKVKTFAGNTLGDYRIFNTFTPSSLIELRYRVTDGGGLRGPVRQTVKLGAAGKEVVAVADRGYSFTGWSDGKKEARRTDVNVRTHVNVVAEFSRTLGVSLSNGDLLADNQIPPVDFGTIRPGSSKRVHFEIRNNSKKTVAGLKVVATGPDTSSWSTNRVPAVLKPGASTRLTITLNGDASGSKLGLFTISGKDPSVVPFRIQVMGVVGFAVASPIARSGSSPDVRVPLASPSFKAKATNRAVSSASSAAWIAVSLDGLIHYRFHRPNGSDGDAALWLSSNGESWTEANVISVTKLGIGKDATEYEAVIEPPDTGDLVWVISENAPLEKKE